jgi:cation diffusion facilitator family transporter
VVAVSFFTMLAELYFGYSTNSRTLIMEGWHMLSHVLVLGLAWLAYWYVKRKSGAITHHQQHRIISLSGFASAIVMLMITCDMIYESVERISSPLVTVANQALIVAVIGLFVNGLSAYYLHLEEEKMDVNLQAAYLHVLSDVVLSLFAIVSLLSVKYFNFQLLDTLLSMIGALIILKWSVDLIRKSWREVLEIKA